MALLVALGMAGSPASAQTVGLDRFRVAAESHRIESYLGQEALLVNDGTAWLDDIALEDVVIELDLAVPDAFSFMGVRFRAADHQNHEYYYIRPHQTGRPDATQYTPVMHGIDAWQIHTGPDYTAPLEFVHDRWMHLRLVAVGRRLEVYLDSGAPVQVAHLVRDPAAGAIGLTSRYAATRFANIRIRPATPDDLRGSRTTPTDSANIHETFARSVRRVPAAGARLVRRLRVSSPFSEERLESTAGDLDASDWTDLIWKVLPVEREGIVNLARLHGIENGNTVFAAVTLTSDRPRRVPVRIGFSDRARVFLNGRPLFAGADGFRARDFRFLGTIGLHDTVYLPLDGGANVLWIAVSEDFGGWGVMVEVPAIDGLRVSTEK